MVKKSNVIPFRTSKDLWISWMQGEEQEFEDPYLASLHKAIMKREQKRNGKAVSFSYSIEFKCEKERINKIQAQFVDMVKIMIHEIKRASKPYFNNNFKDLNASIDFETKDKDIYCFYIKLQTLVFIEDLIETLICNAQAYAQILGIEVLSIKRIK